MIAGKGPGNMSAIEIFEQKPTVADYNRLREAVGWGKKEPAVIEDALAGSLFSVCAVYDGQVVGMGRVVGDGAIWNYIQDIIVLPQYQEQGIGEKIMQAIIAHLSEHMPHGSDVALITRRKNVGFYERYGFVESSPDAPSMRRKL